MTRVHTSQGWRSSSVSVTIASASRGSASGASGMIVWGMFVSGMIVSCGSGSGVATQPLLGGSFGIAVWAKRVLAAEVAMHRTNRECRRDRDVRQAEPCQRAPHQIAAGAGRGQALAEIQMQNRAAGIARLQFLLVLQRRERIVGEADRKLRGIRVV